MKIETIITNLSTELSSLKEKQEKKITDAIETLHKPAELVTEFAHNWAGGWGQRDYDHYNDFLSESGEIIIATKSKIFEFIKEEIKYDHSKIQQVVTDLMKPNHDFHEKMITELALIKGHERLESELSLLEKIESTQWGIAPWDFVKSKQPKSIYTMNPGEILNKGLPTPPHIDVESELMSLFSYLSSIKDFQKNATRLIRQLEIRFSIEESSRNNSDFIEKLIENFHTVARQLQSRHDSRNTLEINDEYDVQDLLNALLRIEFEDVRPEEHTPSYAGSSTRMDFLLKKEKIVIEVKKTRNNLTDKEIGSQLILDFQHYKSHPDCKKLICFVYDPESRIKNPRGLENDLTLMSDEHLTLEVYIRP